MAAAGEGIRWNGVGENHEGESAVSTPEHDYQWILDEDARFRRRVAEQAYRWRSGDFTAAPREEPDDGLKVTMVTSYMPVSEEYAMDLGLIPDTRPAPTPPTWRQRGRTWVRGKVRGVRWWLAAKIGGASREAIEEVSWLW